MDVRLTVSDVEVMAHALARELMVWDEPIPPFTTRFPDRLESCLEAPFQTYHSKLLYPTFAERAAVLFYLMVKNHPFQNGNKRVAVTTLFVFLSRNGKWLAVDVDQLYKFAVDVAKSLPLVKAETIKATTEFVERHLIDA